MAMRPKKPRYQDGVLLADNLYPDPRRRLGYWRYHRPDGRFKTFQAASVAEANRQAEEANAVREHYTPAERPIPKRDQLAFHVPLYTHYRERLNPQLSSKQSWTNRKYAIDQFAREFPQISHITTNGIRTWWDDLTPSQQKLRMAEFRRFFNWLMGQGLVPKFQYNPFTLADDLPRLLPKEKIASQIPPLTEPVYWKIYHQAPKLGYEALQIAMGISRYTTMRESDVCGLRWDRNVVDNVLRVVVAKSENQKGSARAARWEWDLNEHPYLKKLIKRAREMALMNHACPFVISHKPIRRVLNGKEHVCQVLPRRLYDMFIEARDAAKVKEKVVFHGVRGLASTLLKKAGYSLEEIRDLMAQEHISTTSGYINADDLPFQRVSMKIAKPAGE